MIKKIKIIKTTVGRADRFPGDSPAPSLHLSSTRLGGGAAEKEDYYNTKMIGKL